MVPTRSWNAWEVSSTARRGSSGFGATESKGSNRYATLLSKVVRTLLSNSGAAKIAAVAALRWALLVMVGSPKRR